MTAIGNLLRHETSPYLLQHKDNPVHWRPWGEAAFAEARRRGVPVFVSVGYSTCYWCHVMERESFEDAATAAVMNERFVCVKVDREERPDVDQLYMTALTVQTRQGGWPMNVLLLPDGRYFYGGTYFPPKEMGGRPSFTNVLVALSDAYRDERAEVEENAENMADILRRLAEPEPVSRAVTLDLDTLAAVEAAGRADYEPRYGGFGHAPKFPRQTLLQLALRLEREWPDTDRAKQLRHALDAMAGGGIRDHLGGGFHRYSTDAKWRVPHFEIMLYDQALLLDVYADAADLFRDDGYAAVARRLADFVLRELTDEATGGFYSGIDAEVNAREGQNYLWTEAEVRDLLGDAAGPFVNAYGLAKGPNFSDPHHDAGVKTANVLYCKRWRDAENDDGLAEARATLLDHRATRDQPMTDTKLITAWNALMISGLVRAGEVLDEPRYLDAATRALRFLLTTHLDNTTGDLARTSRDGDARHAGLLDDYAYLLRAVQDVLRAGGEDELDRTEVLADAIDGRFIDADTRMTYFSPADGELYVRQVVATDNPLPSAAAVYGEAALARGKFGEAAAVTRNLASVIVGQPGSACAAASLALAVALKDAAVHVEPDDADERGGRGGAMSPADLAEAAVQVTGQWTDDRTLAITLAVAPGYTLKDASLAATSPRAAADLPARPSGNVDVTLRFAEPLTDVKHLELVAAYTACRDDACLPPVKRTLRVLGPATKVTACGPAGCGQASCACTQDA